MGALKYTQTNESADFGAFGAWEEKDGDEDGKQFAAGRYLHKFDSLSLGVTATYTDRPVLEKEAKVYALESKVPVGNTMHIQGLAFQSNIQESSLEEETGNGGYASFQHYPSKNFKQSIEVLSLDSEVDINDVGFLSRNNLKLIGYRNDLVVPYKDHDSILTDEWGSRITFRENNQGESLSHVYHFYNHRKFNDTSRVFSFAEYITEGYSDRLSRGNGSVELADRYKVFTEYYWDQSGKFRHHAGASYGDGGYTGPEIWLHWHPYYFFDDFTNVELGIYWEKAQDWLTWSGLNGADQGTFSRFDKETATLKLNLNHNFTRSQELRFNVQWVGVKAEYNEGYILSNRKLISTTEATDADFTRSQFGLQLRYKYQITPLSQLFVVYSRGGADGCDDCDKSIEDVFNEGIANHDANQFYVKLRWNI